MATRSLLVTHRIDRAGRAHDCQANAKHRIQKGDVRLKVRNGMGWDHYCKACAEHMIAKAQNQIEGLKGMQPSDDEAAGPHRVAG